MSWSPFIGVIIRVSLKFHESVQKMKMTKIFYDSDVFSEKKNLYDKIRITIW